MGFYLSTEQSPSTHLFAYTVEPKREGRQKQVDRLNDAICSSSKCYRKTRSQDLGQKYETIRDFIAGTLNCTWVIQGHVIHWVFVWSSKIGVDKF